MDMSQELFDSIKYNDFNKFKKNLTVENINININCKFYYSATPLFYSVTYKRFEFTEYILQYADENDIRLDLYHSLLSAIENNREITIFLLLKYFKLWNLDINSNEFTFNILFFAIYKNVSIDIIKSLIMEHKVNIHRKNLNGQTILHFIFTQRINNILTDSNRIDILKFMLE